MPTIRIVGYADGSACELAGKYLKRYDAAYVDAEHGYDGGWLEVTADIEEAQVFADAAEALEKWKEQAPPPYDIRLDGKPNRPLTAFTVEVS